MTPMLEYPDQQTLQSSPLLFEDVITNANTNGV